MPDIGMEELQRLSNARDQYSTPPLRELYENIIPNFAAHWKRIGINLNICCGELDAIETDFPRNCQECCKQMLQKWLRSDDTASWKKLIGAIKSAVLQRPRPHVRKAERTLKNRYEMTRFTLTSKSEEWPPNKPQCFISIALVKHMDKEKFKKGHTALATVRSVGAITTIPKTSHEFYSSSSLRHGMKHRPLEMAEEYLHNSIIKDDDIFELLNSERAGSQVILIDGAPGIGKTYLCKEICYQWSQEQLLTSKHLLFILFLREQAVHALNSTKDLIKCSCELADDEAIESIDQYLQDTEGESLTLILDGYDEFSAKHPDHLINRIIGRRTLSKCMIVITSRSSACRALCSHAHQRIEILGFTENDRLKYINQALKNSPNKIAGLKQYLVSHPAISSLCYIPLNMAIFLYLFKEGDLLPKSRTELYKKFVDLTVNYYVSYHPNKELQAVTDTDKLHSKSQALANAIKQKLALFSYNALSRENVVFKYSEVTSICPEIVTHIPGAIHGFGLLQAIEHFSTDGSEKTYSFNFIYSSIQEYLAALYIDSLPDNKQISLLNDTFYMDKYLNTWIMYVGLTQGRSVAFKSFLAGKRTISRNLEQLNLEQLPISSDIMNCRLKCLHVFQCYMEADDPDMRRRVGKSLENKQINLSGETLLPNHMLTLAFFLQQSHQYTFGWDKLDLSSCNIQDIGCFILLRALNECKAKIHIRIISLSSNQITTSSVGTLAELVQKCETEELDISDNKLGDEGAKHFSSCLVGNKTLKLLIMDGNNITSNVADKVKSEMTSNTSLQIISLTSNQLYVKNEPDSHISELLKCPTLSKFSMSCCSITPDRMVEILKQLSKHRQLERLHLSHNGLDKMKVCNFVAKLSTLRCLTDFVLLEPGMHDNSADEMITALNYAPNAKIIALSSAKLLAVQTSYKEIPQYLKTNPYIVTLAIPQCFPDDEQSVDTLAVAIQQTLSLQKIDISQNKLKTAALVKLAGAIKSVVNLKSLIMKSNDINESAAEALANSLRNKCCLEVLDLGVNRIYTKGAIEISKALQNNTMLQKLNLHNNSIDSLAADHISSMLTNKRKLSELDLAQNILKGEGIVVISKALQTITTLKVLNFSANKVTPEASDDLALVLKSNPLIESLNLSLNKLKSQGCITLCKALKKHHRNLRVFNIGCNELESDAVHDIALCLKDKPDLEVVNVFWNGFKTGITSIVAALKSTTSLKTLVLNNCGVINHKAVEIMHRVICNNSSLQVLDISSTHLQRLGAKKIFSALTNNRTLQVLNASDNQIDDNAADQLIHSLLNNFALRELRLDRNPLSGNAIEQILFTINTNCLTYLKVPRIDDEDIKATITHKIDRINADREANNKLIWFPNWF